MTASKRNEDTDSRLWAAYRRGTPRGKAGPCPGEASLASYLDGRASGRERRLMEGHCASCAECRKALAQLRALIEAAPVEAPPRVMDRAKTLVLRRTRDGETAATGPYPLWGTFFPARRRAAGWAIATALIIIACASGYMAGGATFSSRMMIAATPPPGTGLSDSLDFSVGGLNANGMTGVGI